MFLYLSIYVFLIVIQSSSLFVRLSMLQLLSHVCILRVDVDQPQKQKNFPKFLYKRQYSKNEYSSLMLENSWINEKLRLTRMKIIHH